MVVFGRVVKIANIMLFPKPGRSGGSEDQKKDCYSFYVFKSMSLGLTFFTPFFEMFLSLKEVLAFNAVITFFPVLASNSCLATPATLPPC